MLISVLITSYQHERYIARALDGVLEQRGVEYEVLVGDDASTDGTRRVIAEYASSHPALIRTFLPERNLGQGGKAIFSVLVGSARGEYLAMLDGDDYWTSPDKLSRQAAFLAGHPGASMVFHNVLCVHEDEDRPDVPYNDPAQALEVDVPALLERCVVASCSPLFRRAAVAPLPGWYFDLPWGDWPLYFMAAEAGTIHYLPELMGAYRIHRDGMYSRLSRLEALESRTAFYEGLRVPPEHQAARRAMLAGTWVKRALEHNRLGQRAAALRCLGAGVLQNPGALLTLRPGTGETSRTDPPR